MNNITLSPQFVHHDVINKNTTDLAVRCSTESVELSCVAINTPLVFSRNQYRPEAQLSQRGRALLSVVKNVAKSLKIVQGHSKLQQ